MWQSVFSLQTQFNLPHWLTGFIINEDKVLLSLSYPLCLAENLVHQYPPTFTPGSKFCELGPMNVWAGQKSEDAKKPSFLRQERYSDQVHLHCSRETLPIFNQLCIITMIPLPEPPTHLMVKGLQMTQNMSVSPLILCTRLHELKTKFVSVTSWIISVVSYKCDEPVITSATGTRWLCTKYPQIMNDWSLQDSYI